MICTEESILILFLFLFSLCDLYLLVFRVLPSLCGGVCCLWLFPIFLNIWSSTVVHLTLRLILLLLECRKMSSPLNLSFVYCHLYSAFSNPVVNIVKLKPCSGKGSFCLVSIGRPRDFPYNIFWEEISKFNTVFHFGYLKFLCILLCLLDSCWLRAFLLLWVS